MAGWVAAVIGVIAGLTIKPSEKFLISALVLSGISITAATQIPIIGGFLQNVLTNMAWLFGGLAIVPALVNCSKTVRNNEEEIRHKNNSLRRIRRRINYFVSLLRISSLLALRY